MGGGRRKFVLFGLLCAIAVGIGVVAGLAGRGPRATPTIESPSEEVSHGTVRVHVAGWVLSPGVVSVTEGAIVAEAIEAAGGLAVGASVESLNLAAVVAEGDQIIVPGPDEGPSSSDVVGGLVSINQATASELQQLPGVGPVLAERIVAYREDHGRFDEVEDLLEVPGIGESKLGAIRDLVRP